MAASFRGPPNPRGVIDRFTTGGYRDRGAPAPLRSVVGGFKSKSPFKVIGHPGNPKKEFGSLGHSFGGLAPHARFDNVANHAIVLENVPSGNDSRLVFESFPGEWQESYQLRAYRKMGGHRMSQPQFATYQGGDWGPFPLTLVFRAGINDGLVFDPQNVSPSDIEAILLEMEKKVNWLVALGFPLERQNVEGRRIIKKALADIGIEASKSAQEQVANLRRNDPPFVLLILGTWRVIRGYLTNISWTWKPPFHPVSGRPYGCEVKMSFQPIQSTYPTSQIIRNQAGVSGGVGVNLDRLSAADQQRIRGQRVIVTNRLLQNAAARSAATEASAAALRASLSGFAF